MHYLIFNTHNGAFNNFMHNFVAYLGVYRLYNYA